jgi:NADH-quinone oxidoreductase subunit G
MTDTASDAAEAPPVDGVPVTIDGVEVIAREGELVIDAAERSGVYIPRFCYHPRMKPVGMCRMCIVEIDTGRGPALQPSCMLECTPGMTVSTDSPITKKAQDGVLEFLLINHPLDCPVCDKGGECPLQDQTMAYGPGESRFVEEKRHKEKPIPISEVVYLDRERCILCDRCTRFAKEVAGDPLIHFINRGNDTEVNTFPDEPFSSYFSGNTVQICPVGALTAKPYRFKARPWDLDQVESTCQSCSVGCRVAVQSSRNEVLRYVGVDIDPVNWGWLCDKGRFDFEATNSEDRLRDPLIRTGEVLAPARWTDALRRAADAIAAARDAGAADRVAIIGGARLTNEDAYAWSKLARSVIGTDNVDCQLGDGLPADVVLGLPRATIDDVCRPGGTVILAGPDLKEELPVLFLRLRHAIVEDGVTVIELAPQPTGLSSLAAVSLFHRPGEVAETARALLEGLPSGRDGGGVDITELLRARALLAAADGEPTVVVGRQSIAESEVFAADAAASLFRGLPRARFLPALRRSNVHGALDMGLAPGFLPGRISLEAGADRFASAWGSVPPRPGLDTAGILQAAADGAIDVLVLLGADPVADFPDRDLAARALANVATVIAADLFLTDSSTQAHVVFPAAGFGEESGTTTNVEGRVSQLGQKVTPPGTARPDWMIAAELAFHLGGDLGFESVDAAWAEITALAPAYERVEAASFGVDVSSDGVVVPVPMPTVRTNGSGAAAGDADPDAVTESIETVQAEPAEPEAAADTDTDGAGDDEAGGEEHPGPEFVEGDADDPSVAAAVHVLVPGDPVEPSALDAYGLRLIASRKLYDLGTRLQRSPSLAALLPGTVLRVSSYDFDRLGVSAGAQVRITSPKGEIQAEIEADPGLPRGSAAVYVNQPGIDLGALVDAGQRVTDLRIDSGTAS